MMPFGAYDNHLLYMTADIHRICEITVRKLLL